MRFEAVRREAKQPPADSGRPPLRDLAALRARLNRIARSQPAAVLGTVEYWLVPQSAGDGVDLAV